MLGVAYDSYTAEFYWSVEGGQGRVYMSSNNSSQNENGQVLFSEFRRNPFSLKFDWVGRRLYWVEDGDTVSMNDCYWCRIFTYLLL